MKATLITLIASLILSSAYSALLSVAVIHRHGDRNPLNPSFSTDPYKNESHWQPGYGQLTNRGIRRSYDLGKWLRSRYDGFLQPSYSPKFFRAYSTDVDRTLMSGAAVLAGLFPPIGASKWHDDINWRPVPIHTKPKIEDPVLAMKKRCYKYDKLYKELLKSAEIEAINQQNAKLLQFLSEKSGDNVSSIIELELIHNALETQGFNNKTPPDWAKDVYPAKLRPLATFTFKLPCYTQELARLRTGLFFDNIYNRFKKVHQNSHKFVLFSAHDTTLADILTTLKYDLDQIPPFSSALIFELHLNKNMTQYINIIYKKDEDVIKVHARNCEFDCDFEKYTKIMAPIMLNLTQWEAECQNH